MTTYIPENQGRVYFGTLPSRTPHVRALEALGAAVPDLEAKLGFSIRITVEVRPEGSLLAEVLLPDAQYSFEAILTISDALHDAVRPFGIDLDIVPDSDISNGE